MNTVNFENSEIINAVLLSDMVYLENRRLHEIKREEDNLLPVINSLDEDFLFKYNIDSKNLESKEDLEMVLNFAYQEIIPLIEKSDSYREILRKRQYFNWERGDRKNDFKLDENPTLEIEDTEKEIKKYILSSLFNLSAFRNNHNMLEVYQEVLGKLQTSIEIEYFKNPNLEQTKKDTDILWAKFEKVIPNEEIIKKYSNPYETEMALNIVAEFSNGYIDVGRKNGFKDASFMVGYLPDENGEKVLNIVFRGTEDRAMPTLAYFVQHYPNIERQYQRIAPILEEIIEQELEKHKRNNPNHKLKVAFSGHSLGAALAEKALDKHKDNEDISYKGFLVANPGSFHYLQKAINGLDVFETKLEKIKFKDSKFKILGYDAIKSSLNLGKDVLTAGVIFAKMGLFLGVVAANYSKGAIDMGFKPLNENPNVVDKIIRYSTFNCAKMMAVGFSAIISSFGDLFGKISSPFIEYKKADKRAITINHIHDNIPQAGKALFQNENENSIELIEDAPRLTKNPATYQLAYHKTYNYYIELKNRASKEKLFKPKEPKKVVEYDSSRESVLEKIKKMKEEFNPLKMASNIRITV